MKTILNKIASSKVPQTEKYFYSPSTQEAVVYTNGKYMFYDLTQKERWEIPDLTFLEIVVSEEFHQVTKVFFEDLKAFFGGMTPFTF